MSSCARARRLRGARRWGLVHGRRKLGAGGGVRSVGELLTDYEYDEKALVRLQNNHRKARRHDPAPLVCFLRGKAFARRGVWRFTAGSVPIDMCTHVVYSFLETDNHTGEFIFRKHGVEKDDGILESLVSLKERKPKLKVLFSYGGGAHTNSLLKQLHSKDAQKKMVDRIFHLITKFDLNGVNFHLEGPAPSVCDKEKAIKILKFIKALRRRFGSKDLLLTFQLPACRKQNCAPPYKELARHLDYLFLMTFDYKLDDLTKTKLTSGLYFYEGDQETAIESESCLGRWINDDVPKYKIVPGIATHGRSFTLDNPAHNGVGAKLKKSHPLGHGANFTKTDGYMNYVETCRREKYFHWKREWLKYAATAYIYYQDQWISYDDVDSVDVKVKWFRAHWFGGVFVWTLDEDDYSGDCVGEIFPMVAAAWKPLKGYRPLSVKGEDVEWTTPKGTRRGLRTEPLTVGPATKGFIRKSTPKDATTTKKRDPECTDDNKSSKKSVLTTSSAIDTMSTASVSSSTATSTVETSSSSPESSTASSSVDTPSSSTEETPTTYSDGPWVKTYKPPGNKKTPHRNSACK